MSDEGEATTLDDILGRLQRAVQRRFGAAARIENPELATLGGSNRTLLFDLVEHLGRRRLVMRQENYRLAHTPFIAPHDQYRLLELAVAVAAGDGASLLQAASKATAIRQTGRRDTQKSSQTAGQTR